MAISLDQSDNTVTCSAAAACSGLPLYGSALECLAQEGDTAGSAHSVNFGTTNLTTRVAYAFDCVIPSGATWGSGTWVVPINFSNGDMNVTLQEVHVCRVNSSCTNQESLGSTTGIGYATNGGETTVNVTGSSTTPTAGDRVLIVVAFSSNSSHSDNIVEITRNRTITCPFTVSSSSRGKIIGGGVY